MNRWKSTIFRALLDTMFLARIHRLLGRSCGGLGAILTLHHVRPAAGGRPFAPNRILDITPEFLASAIGLVRDLGYDIIPLDEVAARVREGASDRRFVCFTLDDGYADNLLHAAPVFDRLDVPFAVYLTTSLPDATAVLWWEHLEDLVRERDDIALTIDDREFTFNCRSTAQKFHAFNALYWRLRAAEHDVQQAAIADLLKRYDVDAVQRCRDEALTWDQLRTLAGNPRASIGVHTVNHHALRKLADEGVRQEVQQSRERIAAMLDVSPQHFCYPYGDAGSAAAREFSIISELGFETATTTRKGVLFAEHADHLHALPRISLNGDYQRRRYLELFLSGAPFAIKNRFRRLDVA